MGDQITPEERAAIAAFKGPVTRCPDGEAYYARFVIHAAGGYHGFLADMGIMVAPVEWSWKLSDRTKTMGMDRLNPHDGQRSTELRDDEICRLAASGVSHEELAAHFELTKSSVRNILWRMSKAA